MLNFALIGCGRIAVRHADLLASGSIQGARLAAVCDSDAARAEAFGSKHGVPWFPSIDALLAHQSLSLDGVAILTPSGLHAEHVIQVAPHVRNIVVEKPMALTLDDADAMINACDIAGARLFVVKQNRFNVPVQKLRGALEAGRFGKLVLGTVRVRWCRRQDYYDQDAWRGTWALDGGVLANQASHHVDLLEWMLGDPATVFARASTALVDIETEDTAVVVLKFRNGALGVIEATTAARPRDFEGSLSILGAGGTVEIGGFAVNQMKIWEFAQPVPEDADVLKRFSVNPPSVYGFGHQAYYEHVVDCIVNQRRQLVDGLEGRRSLELITAIYESIETGRDVSLRFEPRVSKLGQKKDG